LIVVAQVRRDILLIGYLRGFPFPDFRSLTPGATAVLVDELAGIHSLSTSARARKSVNQDEDRIDHTPILSYSAWVPRSRIANNQPHLMGLDPNRWQTLGVESKLKL
jgi:hypothetical protein